MKVEIVEGIRAAKNRTGRVVVIDAFRASNTILAILEAGASKIIIPSSERQASKLSKVYKDSIYFAEKGGNKLPQADYDNSPSQAYSIDLSGKRVVLWTTRGAKAISAPKRPYEIIVASFRNAQAVAYYLNDSRGDITLVACGEGWNRRAIEDYLCAEYIGDLIRGGSPDYGQIRREIELSNGASRLKERGQGRDLEYCLALDQSQIIPRATRKERVIVMSKI